MRVETRKTLYKEVGRLFALKGDYENLLEESKNELEHLEERLTNKSATDLIAQKTATLKVKSYYEDLIFKTDKQIASLKQQLEEAIAE